MVSSVLRILAVALAGLAVTPVMAFDPAQPPHEAVATLVTKDCQVDVEDCRYFAAMESAAYFDACLKMWEVRYKEKGSAEETAQLRSWLPRWSALNTPAIKQAVLDPENPLRQMLADALFEYLMRTSNESASLECARLGSVMEDKAPELTSELLRATKNYDSWKAQRQAQEQAAQARAQERLQSGHAPDLPPPPPMPTTPPVEGKAAQ